MKTPVKIILLACVTALAGASYADMKAEPAHDPKKKKAGAECKTQDECQRHHSCTKSGEKSVCTKPEYHNLPSIPNT